MSRTSGMVQMDDIPEYEVNIDDDVAVSALEFEGLDDKVLVIPLQSC